jgi:hypothetical protein
VRWGGRSFALDILSHVVSRQEIDHLIVRCSSAPTSHSTPPNNETRPRPISLRPTCVFASVNLECFWSTGQEVDRGQSFLLSFLFLSPFSLSFSLFPSLSLFPSFPPFHIWTLGPSRPTTTTAHHSCIHEPTLIRSLPVGPKSICAPVTPLAPGLRHTHLHI